MSDTALPAKKARVLNVPNMVTISRLILAVVLFGLMSFSQYTAAL